MAHKKGLGSSKNGRDSNAKRLGVNPNKEDYVATVQTANGPAKAAPVVLPRSARAQTPVKIQSF